MYLEALWALRLSTWPHWPDFSQTARVGEQSRDPPGGRAKESILGSYNAVACSQITNGHRNRRQEVGQASGEWCVAYNHRKTRDLKRIDPQTVVYSAWGSGIRRIITTNSPKVFLSSTFKLFNLWMVWAHWSARSGSKWSVERSEEEFYLMLRFSRQFWCISTPRNSLNPSELRENVQSGR